MSIPITHMRIDNKIYLTEGIFDKFCQSRMPFPFGDKDRCQEGQLSWCNPSMLGAWHFELHLDLGSREENSFWVEWISECRLLALTVHLKQAFRQLCHLQAPWGVIETLCVGVERSKVTKKKSVPVCQFLPPALGQTGNLLPIGATLYRTREIVGLNDKKPAMSPISFDSWFLKGYKTQ